MPSVKHIHKFRRHTYEKTKNSVFFCTLPNCHFKLEVPLAIGKESLCNICGEPFLMNERSLKLKKPHCNRCGRRRVTDENGRTYYVPVQREVTVNAEVAEEVTDDLKSRLKTVIIDEHEGEI